jgi:lipopolysaccharide transport system permease protein
MLQTINAAVADIHAAFRRRSVWMALAVEDIGDQHRRTALGPFWLLINYLAFAGTFIFVFQRGDTGAPNYAAYVATGLLIWFFIMETVSQGVMLFVREDGFIKGTTLPLSLYVMRLTAQSVIRTGYALIGCLAILAFSGTAVSLGTLWAVPSVVVVLLTAPAAIIVFAFLGAYFPDSQFIVTNLMRIGMFLTPVFWTLAPGTSGVRAAFYYWNPFTYFLQIVRVPILSGFLPLRSFFLCLAISLTLWLLALVLLGRLRKQVVFAL